MLKICENVTVVVIRKFICKEIMETFIELLKQCEITTVLTMALGLYIFNVSLSKKFESIEKRFDKVDQEIKDVREEIKDVREEVKELRISLNRMEGAFYSKDCCMLKEDTKEKKAK